MKRIFVLYFVIVLFCVSCTTYNFSRYDNHTYTELTELKAKIAMVYPKKYNDGDAGFLVFHALKVYEYAKGKSNNEETTKQADIIVTMLKTHMTHKSEYAWDERTMLFFMDNIQKSIDIAIETERYKNEKF